MTYYLTTAEGLGAAKKPAKPADPMQAQLSQLQKKVADGLNDLVRQTERNTAAIVRKYKNSWTEVFRRPQDIWFSGEKKNPVENWAENINSLAEQVKTRLTKKDDKGVPFFMRHPQEAERLAASTKQTLTEMISDLDEQVNAGSFKGVISTILDSVISALAQLVQLLLTSVGKAALSFPVAAGAVLALFAGLYFLKRK